MHFRTGQDGSVYSCSCPKGQDHRQEDDERAWWTGQVIEAASAKVHERWMDTKHAQGVSSRRSESGEELMVPYHLLSEAAKDLDRGSTTAVVEALSDLGLLKSTDDLTP